MRQLRIKSHLCSFHKFKTPCQPDYSSSNEEKQSFEIGWTNITSIKANSSIEKAFHYRTSNELDTYMYVGDHGKI